MTFGEKKVMIFAKFICFYFFIWKVTMFIFESVIKRTCFLLFCLAFLYLNSLAQTGWNLVRRTAADDLITVFFINSERGWIGGDNGFFATTFDSGKNWTRQILPTKQNINEILFKDDKSGFILAADKIYMSNDAGVNWSEVSNFLKVNEGSPEYYSIRFASKKIGYIVGSITLGAKINSLLIKTEDGGTTWKRIIVPIQAELFGLDFIDEKKGWVVGDNGNISFTDNGGQTWKNQISGVENEIYSVDFRNSLEGYAVGGKGLILRTDNGGNTWNQVKTNYTNTFLHVNIVEDKGIWIVGRSGTILRSDDRGANWLKQDSKTTDNLYGFFMDKKFGWAVGSKGVILKYQR
jgi:photosystem II stability/assembly factor-like uncharacterized protein